MPKFPEVRSLMLRSLGDPPNKARRRALIESVGVSAATVSRWISGESRPDPSAWHAIAGTLGVDASEVEAACIAQQDLDALVDLMNAIEAKRPDSHDYELQLNAEPTLDSTSHLLHDAVSRSARYLRLDSSLQRIDERLARLERRFDRLEGKLEEYPLEGFDERLEAIEDSGTDRFEAIESRLDALEE